MRGRREAPMSVGASIAILFVLRTCSQGAEALAGGATREGTWRDGTLRATLTGRSLEAEFQAGQLVALRHRDGDQPLLYVSDPDPAVALFGARMVNLDSAKARQQVAGRSLTCRYSWPDGSTWDLAWTLEERGDLVLQTAADVTEPVDQMGITFPGCDLVRHALTTVTNFCVGTQVRAPWTGMIGDPETKAYR